MKKCISVLLFLAVISCDKNDADITNRCNLDPDSGPCYGYSKKWYYDKEEKRCKEFIWGLCGGVVPFETLEACKRCECSTGK